MLDDLREAGLNTDPRQFHLGLQKVHYQDPGTTGKKMQLFVDSFIKACIEQFLQIVRVCTSKLALSLVCMNTYIKKVSFAKSL